MSNDRRVRGRVRGTRELKGTALDELIAFLQFNAKLGDINRLFVLLAHAHGIGEWPRRDPLPVFRQFAATHLSRNEIVEYLGILMARKRNGEPLVQKAPPSTVSDARKSRQRSNKIPANADALEEAKRARRQAQARARHRANQETTAYRSLRAQRLELAKHRCERCGAATGLQLHHRHYETLGRERLEDVEVLCDSCHRVETERMDALRRAAWRPMKASRRRS